MRQLTRYQPPMLPGWGPITPPAAPARPTSRVPAWLIREPLIFGVLLLAALMAGVLQHPLGLVAVVAVRALASVLLHHRVERRTFRTLREWFAVALVAAIITGSGAVPKITAAPLRSPVKVDAAQTDQLEQARTTWAKVWQQWAQAFSEVGEDTKKKERR